MSETGSLGLLGQFDTAVARNLRALDNNWRPDRVFELERLARDIQEAFMRQRQDAWDRLVPSTVLQAVRSGVQRFISACQQYRVNCNIALNLDSVWVERTEAVKMAIIELMPLVDQVRDGLQIECETDPASVLARFRAETNLVTRWQLACSMRRLVLVEETELIEDASRVRAAATLESVIIGANAFVTKVVICVRSCSRVLDEFMRGVDAFIQIQGVTPSDRDWDRETDLIGRHADHATLVEQAVRELLALRDVRPGTR